MAKLIYVANVSVDGYIEDEHGNFDWSAPNDEVFAFITSDAVRDGRRMSLVHPSRIGRHG
jgi:hypothetical protein